MPRSASDSLALDVVLAPSLLPDASAARRTVYIVVDVIRATTTLCVQFEQGCRRTYVADSIERARSLARDLVRESASEGRMIVLAGEVDGVAPSAFDHGNSPAEFAALDLRGRDVVFATTNGTPALHACADGVATLIGSLRNATAVARAALELASANGVGLPLTVVCAGRDGAPAFDDTVCAGHIMRCIQREATEREHSVTFTDGASIALAAAADAHRRGLREALATSLAAQALAAVGLAHDLDWCADVDACSVVPIVRRKEPRRESLVVEQLAPSAPVATLGSNV